MRTILGALALFLFIPVFASAQTVPDFPDYTGWELVRSDDLPVLLDGKSATLNATNYRNADVAALKAYVVSLLTNEKKEKWLALYQIYLIEQKPDGTLGVKDVFTYFYEYTGGKWVSVADFSRDPSGKDNFAKLLTERYKIVFQ